MYPAGEPLALIEDGDIISGSITISNCIPDIVLFGLFTITGTSISEAYPGYSTVPNVTVNCACRIPIKKGI